VTYKKILTKVIGFFAIFSAKDHERLENIPSVTGISVPAWNSVEPVDCWSSFILPLLIRHLRKHADKSVLPTHLEEPYRRRRQIAIRIPSLPIPNLYLTGG